MRGGIYMKISYNPLFKKMVDRKLSKGDLCTIVHLSKGTVTKLGKGESVNLDVIVRICETLNIPIQDVVELVEN